MRMEKFGSRIRDVYHWYQKNDICKIPRNSVVCELRGMPMSVADVRLWVVDVV